MKNKSKFTLAGLLLVCFIISLLALCALPAWSQPTTLTYANGAPNFVTPDTNAFPLTLAASAGTNYTANGTNSLDKTLRQDHGVSAFVTVISTNASATTVTLGWDVTEDGTSYTTTRPIQWAVPANFVGTNTYWTNWSSLQVNNLRQMQLTLATNNSAYTVKLINFQYSQSGNQP
jgi:Tfp pilus assembly protein PilE